MESRLLLSGNQTGGGDLDAAIWDIDSPGDNYVVISLGDTASAPTTASNNPTPVIDRLTDDISIGLLGTNQAFTVNSLLNTPLVVSNSTPSVITTIVGSGGTNDTLDFDGAGNFDLTSVAIWHNSPGASVASFFDGTSANDSALGFESFFEDLRIKLGRNLDALDAETDAPVFAPVVELVVLHPLNSASIAYSFTFEIESSFPSTGSQGGDANVASSKVEAALESNVGKQVDTVAPESEAAAILPVRQPARDERLAEAIDDLLSEDTIIVSPSGQSGSEFVAGGATDGATSDLAANGQSGNGANLGEAVAQQFVDGGMIPLDVIVSATTGNATAIASPDTQLALDESNDVVGELSRVAVMELIEGEAEPGAPQATDRVILVAADDARGPLEVVEAVTRRAGVAISLAAPAGSAYLTTIASAAVDAASRAMATLVGSNLNAASDVSPADVSLANAARSEAFSLLGGDDDRSPVADEGLWNPWLAVAPLAVAVACERALAAKMKRQQQRDPARPSVKAK